MFGFVKDELDIPWINLTEKIVYESKKLPLLISYNVTL
jgi:hypothetical protein